jgi:hypothetical protein
MFNCSGDPFENYLKPFGYSVVVLPREDIHPLQLAAPQSSRRLESIGALGSVFKALAVPLPPVTTGTALDLSGQSSGKLKVGVGLKLFGSALAAIGATPMSLSAGFTRAATISFQFSGVSRDSVDFAAVDAYLADADLAGASPSVAALLAAGELHVVLAVLRSNRISITARDDKDQEVAVDLAALHDIIGGKLAVTPEQSRTSTVSIETGAPLAFGIKAVRISARADTYTGIKAPPVEKVVLESVALAPDTSVSGPAFADPDLVF